MSPPHVWHVQQVPCVGFVLCMRLSMIFIIRSLSSFTATAAILSSCRSNKCSLISSMWQLQMSLRQKGLRTSWKWHFSQHVSVVIRVNEDNKNTCSHGGEHDYVPEEVGYPDRKQYHCEKNEGHRVIRPFSIR